MSEIASYAVGLGFVPEDQARALRELEQKRIENAAEFGDTIMRYANPVVDSSTFDTQQHQLPAATGHATGPVISKLLV